jgi:DNA modification methylase
MIVDDFINTDSIEGLKQLDSNSVDCCITSPPYWSLRDYHVEGQLGLEKTYQEYIDRLCNVYEEVRRVLKDTGTCWINIGDSYSNSGGAGSGAYRDKHTAFGKVVGGVGQSVPHTCKDLPAKSLCNIPAKFSIAMQDRGWILRNEIIWHKPNCMPSSVKDRFTVDFEKVFFFVKKPDYYFKQLHKQTQFPTPRTRQLADKIYSTARSNRDGSLYDGKQSQNLQTCSRGVQEFLISIRKTGRQILTEEKDLTPEEIKFLKWWIQNGSGSVEGPNLRCVWKIPTKSFHGAHFAVFPEALIEPMIKAGCPEDGLVLDPFSGAGTTCLVAKNLGRHYIGIELNSEYITMARGRLNG